MDLRAPNRANRDRPLPPKWRLALFHISMVSRRADPGARDEGYGRFTGEKENGSERRNIGETDGGSGPDAFNACYVAYRAAVSFADLENAGVGARVRFSYF